MRYLIIVLTFFLLNITNSSLAQQKDQRAGDCEQTKSQFDYFCSSCYRFYLFYLLEIILYPRIGFKSLLFFIFEIYIVCICIDRPRLSISVQRYKFDVTA
jgi:hypothetical protein